MTKGKSLSITPEKSRPHFYLLDLIRTISFIAIVTFHGSEFIFYTPIFPPEVDSFFYSFMEPYSRLIPFSGQTIVALSFFLWGYLSKDFKKLTPYFGLFVIGHTFITLNFHEKDFLKNIEWDIYPFLFISFLILGLLKETTIKTKFLSCIACLFILLIPPDIISSNLPINLFKGMLWSTCSNGGNGAWSLFPWLALPLGFYFGGQLARLNISRFEFFGPREKWLWSMILMISASLLIFRYPGSLYNVHIGNQFYCQIFNLNPVEFWSYFIWPVFLIRLSLIRSLNNKLSQIHFFKLISQLYWNKSFGMTYLFHIFILFIGSFFERQFYQHHQVFDLFYIGLFILPELITRTIHRLRARRNTPVSNLD